MAKTRLGRWLEITLDHLKESKVCTKVTSCSSFEACSLTCAESRVIDDKDRVQVSKAQRNWDGLM